MDQIREGIPVLDMGCGYGGTLRELARLGCYALGIDISQVCVDTARLAMNEAGIDDRISVEVGDFHNIPSKDGAFDACICQESIIHSTNKPIVFAEAFRVLRHGGVFAFSDILTAQNADLELVDAAFQRLGVRAGATLSDYRQMAEHAGFKVIHIEERPKDIEMHYVRLAEQLASSKNRLCYGAFTRFMTSMMCWQSALAGGHITWACCIARKP